jgi:hypothetical protein
LVAPTLERTNFFDAHAVVAPNATADTRPTTHNFRMTPSSCLEPIRRDQSSALPTH